MNLSEGRGNGMKCCTVLLPIETEIYISTHISSHVCRFQSMNQYVVVIILMEGDCYRNFFPPEKETKIKSDPIRSNSENRSIS